MKRRLTARELDEVRLRLPGLYGDTPGAAAAYYSYGVSRPVIYRVLEQKVGPCASR